MFKSCFNARETRVCVCECVRVVLQRGSRVIPAEREALCAPRASTKRSPHELLALSEEAAPYSHTTAAAHHCLIPTDDGSVR